MPNLLTQPILGTEKSNPLFTIDVCEEGAQEKLHVYYGFELLEVVSADRNDPNFKMLVGRLYNAQLNRRVLQETFGVADKTMRRWGEALRGSEAEELVRRLAGRKAARKLTPQIEAYVRVRWPELSGQGTYGISSRLRREIKSVFGVKLSGETLRPLVGELKRGRAMGVEPEAADGGGTTASPLPQPEASALPVQEVSMLERETPGDCSPENLTEKEVAALEAGRQTVWCDHAGVLMFAPALMAVAAVVDPPEPLFKQWLASLWLGALNIEQTKFLNWEDLSRLLGTVVRFPLRFH